jgi:16S rRNA C967 or C1407 C5-methylase (RsmB/RsmF family)
MEAPPNKLQLKLSRKLFADTQLQSAFLMALDRPPEFHPCILWCQPRPPEYPFDRIPPVDWQPEFVDRLALDTKPGKDPLHEAGAYYCLDFSSVFAASILNAIDRSIETIFDLCAAPGGKSVFAWQLFKPKLIIANETISKRVGMLVGNFRRCGIIPSAIFSADPRIVADSFGGTCDLVLVDAPCSGQSLLAKGTSVPGCFHPVTIDRNANRQKRILANAAHIVAPQGYLAYTTCTYSIAENEGVCEWFISKFPDFQPIPVPALNDYRSHLSSLPGYRLFPHTNLGAGSFAMLFKNTATSQPNELPIDLADCQGFRTRLT